MIVKTNRDRPEPPAVAAGATRFAGDGGTGRILVIEARFYDAIADELAAGAVAELEAAGVGYDRIAVPGALEIPQVLAAAVARGATSATAADGGYVGAVALGCVIRGETAHFDVVVGNANHWLMHTAITHAVPVGNGILTVDTMEQALARARGGRDGKGGDAARACLALIAIAGCFEGRLR
ncbi:MAG: 6,7-dimethyl-8-ribityllumazine synthase [Hyphomicrobiaceae bacterium]|nr:6,7-dimethyl-8-ribityllumazine synthase [Hyphomicrobiaceae bacterium]